MFLALPHDHPDVFGRTDAPLVLVPTHVNQVKEVYFEWVKPKLERQLQSAQASVPSQSNFEDNLRTLARLFDDEEIVKRDACMSESFHAIRPTDVAGLKGLLDSLGSRESQGFSLYGGGAPESWTDASMEEKLPWRSVRW